MPDSFFNTNTLVTLPGCVLIVGVVCNGLQKAFGFNPRWLALVLSIILCLVGVYMSDNTKAIDYFLAIINGFLVFSSATGLTELGHQVQKAPLPHRERGAFKEKATTPPPAPMARGFFTSWFK